THLALIVFVRLITLSEYGERLPRIFLPPGPPTAALCPYTTLFRSLFVHCNRKLRQSASSGTEHGFAVLQCIELRLVARAQDAVRSEEHTSELQSRENLVCRLLLEKKKNHPRIFQKQGKQAGVGRLA